MNERKYQGLLFPLLSWLLPKFSHYKTPQEKNIFPTNKICFCIYKLFTTSASQIPHKLIILGFKVRVVTQSLVRLFMSDSTSSSSVTKQMHRENEVEQTEILIGKDAGYGGVRVEMKEPMDPMVFASLLRNSISHWRDQGKTGVWIQLPIKLVNLAEAAVQEGFRFHHAEPDYLMLVYWIPDTTDTIPVNASHRVGISAFVINSNREVLVVQESKGKFAGTGVWKFPTGVINEGEDIYEAAAREVKEETGVDTKFVEILAFRQSHKSFFSKSDLMFVCMLQPLSFNIEKQDLEIHAARWMPVEEYAAQPFVQKNELFKYTADICLAKKDGDYTGFSYLPAKTGSGKSSGMYFNCQDLNLLPTSDNQC